MADDQYVEDYDGEEEEDFSDYVPTSRDLGWWLVLGVFLFCVLLVVIVSIMLWRTRKKRKDREMTKGAAIAAARHPENTKEDEDAESVGTASTEVVDSSDTSSIITEIEDDCDSITSTTVPIVDTMFACNGEEAKATTVVAKKNTNRFGRSHTNQVKRFFPDIAQHQNGFTIELADTRALFELQSAAGIEPETGFVQMDDEEVKPPPHPQVDSYEPPISLDCHQMDEPDVLEPSLASVPNQGTSPNKREKHSRRASIPRFLRFKSSRSRTTKAAPIVSPPPPIEPLPDPPPPPPPPIEPLPDPPEHTKVEEIEISVYSQFMDEVEAVSGRNAPPFVASGSLTIDEPPSAREYHHLDDTKAPMVGSDVTVPKEDNKEATEKDMVQPESEMVVTSRAPGPPPVPQDIEFQSKDTQTLRVSEQGIDAYDREVPGRPFIVSICRKIRHIAVYENEMKKILKLAIPYSLTALFECISEILTIAVIGKLLGTRELSAYIAVHFALSVTTLWIEGPLDSLAIVCSQAIGAGENKLAGEYLQIAVVITQILYLPLMVLWVYLIDDLILWLGFDEETALIGYDYAIVLLINELFGILYAGLHNFLEICDYEEFSAIVSISHNVTALVTILSVALTLSPTLQTIGVIHFAFDVVFFLFTVACVQWNGWLQPYWSGIVGSFAFRNIRAVKHLLRTAVPLSIAHLLSGGEFEVLFLFASFLGPAEVVAWGIFGELWEGIETITSALADAAEVRCAYLLGADKPMRAKHSAQKSMLLAFIEGVTVAAFLAATANFLPEWLTNDLTLQTMLRELIPILCIGVLFDTVGSVSFALVGAQGRLKLATMVLFIGSWILTLPLAFVSAAVFNINLEGFAAAVVVGNALSGMTNTFFLLSSDWYEQAAITKKRNKKRAMD